MENQGITPSEPLQRKRLGIAAIWAIALWPAINFLAANWLEVVRGGLSAVAGLLLITLAIALIGHVLYRSMRRWTGENLVVLWVAAIGLFFGYMAVRNATSVLLTKAGLQIPASAGWLVVSAVVLFAAWRLRNRDDLQIAAVTFSLAASIIAAGTLLFTALRSGSPSAEPMDVAVHGKPATQRHINIYYLLLDGYSGARGLVESFKFDNSPFIARMSALGFRDLTTEHSNYLRTTETLGGIFSLDYSHTEDPGTWINPARVYPSIMDGFTPPALISQLRADGYSAWFSGINCPARHARCLGDTVAQNRDFFIQSFLAPTPLGRLLFHLGEARRDAIDPLEVNLPAMLSVHQPIFVFAHHLAPHPPFSRDPRCREREVEVGAREGYVQAVECVNLQVERVLKRILALDPGAFVVLQGDHGSGLSMQWDAPMADWTTASVRERASYLNLVRAPAECWSGVDRPLGQINTARFLVACVEGRAPEFVRELTYISTYSSGAESNVVRLWRDPVQSE